MLTKTVAVLFCAVLWLACTEGAKVLIYPYGHCMNSHLLNAEKLADILSADGHRVNMLISDMYHTLPHTVNSENKRSVDSNVELVSFPGPTDYTPVCDLHSMDFMLHAPLRERFDALINTAMKYCTALLSTPGLLHQLKAANYDVFIMEALDPCSRILADYLDVPFIPLLTTGLGHWDGNPRPPSYMPAAISPFTPDMSFMQRMVNLMMKMSYEIIPTLMGFDPPFEELKKSYGLNTSLSIGDTMDRASLKLVNSHFAVEYPAPIEPDTIMIGGFAIQKPKPLIADLENFMQSADRGVIVMSFGTLIREYDAFWTRVFLDAFRRLPQKVIWRYSPVDCNCTDMLDIDFPENVLPMKWIPQADLLAHPKTRLFITHAGLNAMYESVNFGKPVVAIPLSGDQMAQATKLTDHLHMGVQVDVFSITTQKVYDSIQTVLGEPGYADNARAASRRMHDEPVTPKDKINFWVDYVARNKGAPHLKSVAHKLSWYQYLSLDVIACLCLVVSILASIVVAVLALILCYCHRLFILDSKLKMD